MKKTVNTIRSAKRTLNRARLELHHAKGEDEGMRQASEKAWRAARESVYAVLSAAGVAPEESTLSTNTIASFEARVLGRSRSRGQPLADGYARAIHLLHGLCFYDASCPSEKDLIEEFKHVAWLIEQAEADVDWLSTRSNKTRKK